MSRLTGSLLGAGVLALLAWGGFRMHRERLAEQGQEAVPQAPPRLDHGVLLLSPEAETLAGIRTEKLVCAPSLSPDSSTPSAPSPAASALAALEAEDARFGHGSSPKSRSATASPAEPVASVLLPEGAVLKLDGKTWIYLQESPGRYLRKEAILIAATQNGWLASGVPAGATAVVDGAQILLSEEFRGGGEEE